MNSTVLSLPDENSDNAAIIIPAAASGSPAFHYSFRKLSRSVQHVQHVLSTIGITKGSTVVLALPNGLEVVVAFLATLGQRAIAAPVNPQYKEFEYQEMFRAMHPSLLITAGLDSGPHQAAISAARALGIPIARCVHNHHDVELDAESPDKTRSVSAVLQHEIAPSDVALLLYTSGTTGPPKGVTLTHENILVSMKIIIQAHSLSPSDRCLLVTPLFHVAGLCASLLTTLFSGGGAIIPSSLSGSFWQHFKDHNATWFHGVPTLHRLLLSFPRPQEMPKIRFVRSGGSELDPVTFGRLENEFRAPLLEIYGMTETSPGIFCNGFNGVRRLGHYPIPEAVEVRILQGSPPVLTCDVGIQGEICVKGKSIMSGYVNNPVANEQGFVDGYFRTGDLGVILDGKYLQLTGRIKDVINKGGEKISPSEIENIVFSHDAVQQVVCFKVFDDIYGEDIGVAVVLETGKELTTVTLKSFIRQKVAAFKVPKKIVFMDKIPTNRTGKPRRAFLTETYSPLKKA